MFMAVGALCSQLTATRRQAAAMAAAVFGVAYLIRLIAYTGTSLMWLRWASPLGWVDELRPLTGSRPLLLLPVAGLVAVLAAAAVNLAGRRDLGASVLPARDTAVPSTRLLNSPLGLAARLARRSALSWLGGLVAGGLILGLTVKGTETVFSSQSGGVLQKLGGASGGAAYLGIAFLIVTLVIALAAAGQVAATRDEEAEGYLDHLLARPVARLPWLAGRLAVSVVLLTGAGLTAGLFTWAGAAATGAGLSFATMLAAGVNVIPAGIFVLGIGTLVHGLAPRLTVTAAYAIVAWSFLVEIIGASLGVSRWLLDTSILHHIARAPPRPCGGTAPPSWSPSGSPPLSPARRRSPAATWRARELLRWLPCRGTVGRQARCRGEAICTDTPRTRRPTSPGCAGSRARCAGCRRWSRTTSTALTS